MAFPESDRVIYARNPLTQVVSQLRFPPVLTIEADIPARFQQAIRARFPLFSEVQPAVPQGLPPALLKLIPAGLGIKTGRAYEFATENREWKLILAKDSIALACSRYERWEHFRERLQPALNALAELYAPAFFTRIGLRYVNHIRRSAIGLQNVAWADLIQTYVAPEMATPIAADIDDTEHALVVRIDDRGGKVRIYHGLASHQSGEQVYQIDNDFHTNEKTEVADAMDRLDHFHQQSGNLFRWCIADGLHQAMEPNVVAHQQAS